LQLTVATRHLRPVGAALCAAALLSLRHAGGAVLPEDRGDILYHRYSGGGIEIQGPSITVRQGLGDAWSFSGNYYVDSISGASIDVVTTASPYTEKRTEYSVSADYLRGEHILSGGYKTSSENDYQAETAWFSASQDMFGDLTTVTIGFSYGRDTVGMSTDPDFAEPASHRTWSVGLSQILTRDLIAAFNWDTVSDEGFLNNPYRSVRYLDPDSPIGYAYQPERYPRTRTSNAAGIKLRYYLPGRAALGAQYRYFTDTWGIRADTVELSYTHPFRDRWRLDLRYRYYDQNRADFYSDLFPRQDAQNYLARDKELSTFSDYTLGFGLSYEFTRKGWGFIDRGSLNFKYDRIRFDYKDFRDLTAGGTPGTEPLYTLDADVIQAFVSLWY